MKHLIRGIRKELKGNLLDYGTLLGASIFFITLLGVFRGEKVRSFSVLVGFVFFYICWGTYHHMTEGTLRLKTVIEYVLIGFIALFILAITFAV